MGDTPIRLATCTNFIDCSNKQCACPDNFYKDPDTDPNFPFDTAFDPAAWSSKAKLYLTGTYITGAGADVAYLYRPRSYF